MPQSSSVVIPQSPLVFCVVLNWNGWRDTVACVHSLLLQDYPALRIVIVDNASTDDSVEQIGGLFPDIPLLRSDFNRGFAAGCNLGIRSALERRADFIWLLNNDTIAPPDTLTKLVTAVRSPKTGMVGTVLYRMDQLSKVQAWGGGSIIRLAGFTRHFLRPEPLRENSFLTFASVLLRREVLLTAGLLDEGFFMYFEDADLCFRARDAGWQLIVAADTAVLHREGGSGGFRNSAVVTSSGLRFLQRHGRPPRLAMVLYVLSRLAKRLIHGDLAGCRAVLQGVSDWRQNQRDAAHPGR